MQIQALQTVKALFGLELVELQLHAQLATDRLALGVEAVGQRADAALEPQPDLPDDLTAKPQLGRLVLFVDSVSLEVLPAFRRQR